MKEFPMYVRKTTDVSNIPQPYVHCIFHLLLRLCIAYTFMDIVWVINNFPNIIALDYSFRRKMVYQEIW